MESNATKRKKRKTRKCLDEIRKRSRRTGQILFESDDNKLGEMYSKNIPKCMITSNRLTLRMFPNAIRSKTITRPALLDLEHKPNMNFEELVKGKKVNCNLQNTTRVRIPLNDFGNGNEFFTNKTHVPDNHILSDSVISKETIIQNADDGKENFDLFSSMDELTNKSPNSIGTQSVSTITSTSTQSLHEDNGYALYEEFMSEVPACLQQNSKLVQEDIMKKTKMLLQNLFIESCYQECEDNILKCIKNDPPKNKYFTSRQVVHNPMDYIRLGHIQEQNECHKMSGSLSESESSSCSPLRAPSSLTSPSDALQDTPDYTYYPHRLN